MENQNIKYKDVPLIKEIEKFNDNILYYGEGGIGKTTQMQLAFNYFSSKCTNTVPIFLDADEEIDFRKADPLMSAIAGKYLGSDIETDDIWKLFTNNSPSSAKNYTYIIFVDGINELTQNNKGYLIEKITHIIDESKNTRFIISSRIKENLGLRFKNIAIKPLEKKNILKYLGENYGVNDNSKNINDSLVEILQIPLYLSVFKNTYKGSDYKPNIYDESTVRKADILDSYIQKILHEKRKTNATDTVLFEFIVKYFLPALAFEMVKENVFSIDYDSADRFCESTKYFKGIAKRRFVDFNINSADTICVSNCALLEAHNDVYTFPHQIWRDYFCAKHIINCLNVAYSDQIQNDLEVPVDNEIRGFVGQLIYTYDEKLHYSKEEHFPPEKSCRMCECDFEAKDNLEDWDESPIEHYMQQHNLEQEEQNQISPLVTRNLIEIMKDSRNNHITSNYNYLDLRKSLLFGEHHILNSSSFNYSKIVKDVFLPKITSDVLSIAFSEDGKKSAYLTVDDFNFKLYIFSHLGCHLSRIPKEIIRSPYFISEFTMNFYDENTISINIGCNNKCLVYDDNNDTFNIIDTQIDNDKKTNVVSDIINEINNEINKEFNIAVSQIDNNRNTNTVLKIINNANKIGRKYIFVNEHEIRINKHSIVIDSKVYYTIRKANFLECTFDYKGNRMAASTNNGEIYIFNYEQSPQKLILIKKIYCEHKYIYTLNISDNGVLSYYDGLHIVNYKLIGNNIKYISMFAAYHIDRIFTMSFNGAFSIIGSKIWDNELYVEVKNIEAQKTVDSIFIRNFKKVCFGDFNGCFALLRNHNLEIWSVISYKLSLVQNINLSGHVIDYDEVSLSFTESGDILELEQNGEIVFTTSINFKPKNIINKRIYNLYLHQNRTPVIYANIINCNFQKTIFCESQIGCFDKFNDYRYNNYNALKIALKQSGAIISTDEHLPNGIIGLYDDVEKINIRGLMFQMQKKYNIKFSENLIDIFRKYFIAALNLGYIKIQSLYETVDFFFNHLNNYKTLEMNIVFADDDFYEELKIFSCITKILTKSNLKSNENNYGLQETLIALIAQKLYDRSKSNQPKHQFQYEALSHQINIRLLSNFNHFVYPINLLLQLFLVFHINYHYLICEIYQDGFLNHLKRIVKVDEIQLPLQQFDSLFCIWQNRKIFNKYSIHELDLLKQYETNLKNTADKTLVDNNNNTYLAFFALSPKLV